LTLVQTRIMKPFPILLLGKEYWQRVIDFEFLVEEGTISPEDLGLFSYVETAEEAWNKINAFYENAGVTGLSG
jgi:predicted Rossmann-fold nucleotide-binding protein